jgi:hypothetical protein
MLDQHFPGINSQQTINMNDKPDAVSIINSYISMGTVAKSSVFWSNVI